MKNLLLVGCFFIASLTMSSCTAEPIENENPVIHADDSTNPLPLPLPNQPTDHGGGTRDKDNG